MRIQLEFPGDKVQELKALMAKGDIKTYHELFNNALTLAEWAIKETEQRRIIVSLDEGSGRVKELVMPFLQNVAAKLPPLTAAASAHGE